MNKFVYILLVFSFLFRLNQLCEGRLRGCSERVNEEKYLESINDEHSGFFERYKNALVIKVRKHLPSPHSELLLGMTLGIDKFYELPIFSEMLRKTGTIHVVVVSGYNVTLVFTFIISLLGSMYKQRNLVIAMLGTLLYSLISGFDPPVVRAWLMGGLLMLGKYYGLRLNVLLVLIFSGLVLLILEPSYIYSLSFKLSFVATLSLVVFDDLILKSMETRSTVLLDLKSTLAAQVLIWPVISYYFGQVSLISPLVNMLVLWTVPIATVLGSFYVLLTFLNIDFFLRAISQIIYIPLDIFVRLVEIFSMIPKGSVSFQISIAMLLIYYVFLILFVLGKSKK